MEPIKISELQRVTLYKTNKEYKEYKENTRLVDRLYDSLADNLCWKVFLRLWMRIS